MSSPWTRADLQPENHWEPNRCPYRRSDRRLTRPLTVLDVAADSDGAWATRAGGTYASPRPHTVTQRWARTIIDAHPNIDGLRDNSRFAGAPCLALFTPAADAMPDRPKLLLSLTHPDLAGRIAGAAKRLGYGVV